MCRNINKYTRYHRYTRNAGDNDDLPNNISFNPNTNLYFRQHHDNDDDEEEEEERKKTHTHTDSILYDTIYDTKIKSHYYFVKKKNRCLDWDSSVTLSFSV